MRLTVNLVAAVAATAAFVSAVSLPALAECKKYGFTVNDYGKDGPTRDAKSLLDKLIGTKMSEMGIKDFHTGKKSVSCELFLNFIVFDEHTCTAEATVCWGGSSLPKSDQTAASDNASEKKSSSAAAEHKAAKKKEVAKTSAPAHVKRKTAVLRIPDPKKPSESIAAAPQSETTHTSESASSQPSGGEASSPETAAAKPVETGSLREPAKTSTKHHHTEKRAAPEAATPAAGGAGYPTPEPPQDEPAQ
ncbi:hypothetical protein [Hyphomicrobium sp.]|jgi:hypothetical protein|uniref:hypothetical protein n=1 Tax=Hyphomicrobium sp. TaxID=82 RepID=UPI002B8D3E57|nr:hypothetical protein [Hyphomicrobium sp.]HVZ03846.1 hypothetical protein [Hyphomicrobium sp.]